RLLVPPVFGEQDAHASEVGGAQGVAHALSRLLETTQRIHDPRLPTLVGREHAGDGRAGEPGLPRVAQDRLPLERGPERGVERDRLHAEIGVAEAQAVDPAPRRGELTLLAPRDPRLHRLEVPGRLRDVALAGALR